MNFLVIEGIDGSGKSTQIKRLTAYLEQQHRSFRYIHFPRTDTPYYGDLISRFLRGDFGDIRDVDPYLVALLYAGDRKDAAATIRQWLAEGYLVLLDRYVYSNIAFQCAKVEDEYEREVLRKWILGLEYECHGIPKPDMNILLDVPFSFTKKNLQGERSGSERDYLRGNRDIHEEDLDFQQKVREMYHWQASLCEDMTIINCLDPEGNMLSPDIIFKAIKDSLHQII